MISKTIFTNQYLKGVGLFSKRYMCSSSNVIKTCKDFYAKEEGGKEGTHEYRVKFYNQHNEQISPWHSIPLVHSVVKGDGQTTLYNFICEMPKSSTSKMEVNTKELFNPIKQDIKKGQLRYIKHGNIPYNYGCLPQTWECPTQNDKLTGLPGDNDPLDVVEVSSTPFKRGTITAVKIIGAVPLIDEGETDWKLIAISNDNALFSQISNLEQLEKHLPGTCEKIKNWYQFYKTSEGKEPNKLALNGRILDSKESEQILQDNHLHWKHLISDNTKFILQ
ncbi:inorganic pyrophosphatase [Tieghemostelium lacteum]|uniref:inorganic diphosphatase n=1 Tax=Tieghemostelium lacteum TaxID=361077 RepID=A0A151ZH26_TIELA|nr:inorganic pyrophosphatase [Tieghemostelium lacteum]|eukprot:KYQ93266.1 inorganic pyrophosphatase [Tieghemostelium lacteum]